MVNEKKEKLNAKTINQELDWLTKIIDCRFKLYFDQQPVAHASIYDIHPPSLTNARSDYANQVKDLDLNFEERFYLILALAPHVKPEILDMFFLQNSTFNRGFTEFGGVKGTGHGGFIPTGETVLFILGEKLETRFLLHQIFDGDHTLSKTGILTIEPPAHGEPFLSGKLVVSREYTERLTTGRIRKPNFSRDFPAKLIDTKLEWEDLVLPQKTLKQIEEIKTWMDHGETLMDEWGLRKKIRPGIRVLLYGPPGTGKTMTSCLLGKLTNRDVYRIDLSMVISKYIGETEENLGKVFNQAENKNWILFFDEADALFGSRTQTESANDMFANQQVSYLLQRIEDFDGVVILSSNMKANIDKAFIRRFELMIQFTPPSFTERMKLWTKGFSDKATFAPDVDLREIAKKYELTGAAIMNVIRHSSLMALNRNSTIIEQYDIYQGVKREFAKEEKTI